MANPPVTEEVVERVALHERVFAAIGPLRLRDNSGRTLGELLTIPELDDVARAAIAALTKSPPVTVSEAMLKAGAEALGAPLRFVNPETLSRIYLAMSAKDNGQ